ncbi:MAG: FHA domain-containing protein [Victivallales bacterium]
MPYISYMDKEIRKYFKLAEDKMNIFGREDHVNFQICDDSLISREHFGIGKEDRNNFSIIDLGSSNGTYLNDRKIEANSTVLLKNGDKITAGHHFFYFLVNIEKQNSSDAVSDVLKRMNQGKGYNTIMCEILGKSKKDKAKT